MWLRTKYAKRTSGGRKVEPMPGGGSCAADPSPECSGTLGGSSSSRLTCTMSAGSVSVVHSNPAYASVLGSTKAQSLALAVKRL